MNKRQIIASLNNIANELDLNNLYKEANTITKVMIKIAAEDETPSWLEGLSDDELPRWIKEQRDRAQNPPKPQVLHPSDVELNQKVENIYPIFMEQYNQFWDQHDVELPSSMDPRIINEMTYSYLVNGKNDPVEFLKTQYQVTSGKYKDWFQQNFNFLVDHIKFIENFQESQDLNVGIIETLLRKSRGH